MKWISNHDTENAAFKDTLHDGYLVMLMGGCLFYRLSCCIGFCFDFLGRRDTMFATREKGLIFMHLDKGRLGHRYGFDTYRRFLWSLGFSHFVLFSLFSSSY